MYPAGSTRVAQDWKVDSAPAHSAIHVHQFLAQEMVAVLDHSPYSPDLTPADFFLFPRLKATIKVARFVDVNAIKDHVTAVMRSIPQEVFADCFRKLYERCQTCVVAESDYFEGQYRLLFVSFVLFVS